MQQTNSKACKQEKCNISKDGKCLEGLNFSECPHFFWGNEIVDDGITEISKKAAIPQVQLQSGEELSLETINLVTFRYATKKIFIIGDSDCGKTTLLVRLFNLFQKGPFGDFLFAGSTTMIGFERRSHLTKVDSNGEDEKTEKTKSREFSFLHLAIKHKVDLEANAVHLLLSDISGERIQLSRDSSAEMTELAMLKNSDWILVMIDGAKIVDRKDRTATLLRSQTFLRQALDDGIISSQNKVRIILSKWDLLSSVDGFSLETDVIKPFTQLFGNRIPRLSFQEICTRSQAPTSVDSSHGLNSLLADLTTTTPVHINRDNFTNQNVSRRAISNYFVQEI